MLFQWFRSIKETDLSSFFFFMLTGVGPRAQYNENADAKQRADKCHHAGRNQRNQQRIVAVDNGAARRRRFVCVRVVVAYLVAACAVHHRRSRRIQRSASRTAAAYGRTDVRAGVATPMTARDIRALLATTTLSRQSHVENRSQ